MTPFDAAFALQDAPGRAGLVDGFGRAVRYLRMSVTDRCDLRCVYCMAPDMTFLPKSEVLSLEELERLAGAFIDLGVTKLRLTGGEPLMRKGLISLVERLSQRLEPSPRRLNPSKWNEKAPGLGVGALPDDQTGATLAGSARASGALSELTLTTNATRLEAFAGDLARLGVRRINVSLDTLDPDRFRRLTRGGDLARVLAGINAAQAAGLAVKINTVALKSDNASEIPALIGWAHGLGMDVTLIETMPLGDTGEDRTDQFLSLAAVRQQLESFWTLTDLPLNTGGPARYVRIAQTGGRLGLITPMTHNFCDGCNRVRLTCTGVLHTCLGREDASDLRAVLRAGAADDALKAAILSAIQAKPRGHDFQIGAGAAPSVARHMSTTGG